MANVKVQVQRLDTKEMMYIEVDEAVLSGEGGGGGASDISELTDTTGILDAKVDVVTGKGLSTNDFTDALETKLNALPIAADLPADVSDLTDTTNLIPANKIAITAYEDLAANRFVGYNAGVCSFDGKALGVAPVGFLSGAIGDVQYSGIVPVEVGEAITIGAEVASDGTGKAVNATMDSKINGRAVTGGSTGTILVLLA